HAHERATHTDLGQEPSGSAGFDGRVRVRHQLPELLRMPASPERCVGQRTGWALAPVQRRAPWVGHPTFDVDDFLAGAVGLPGGLIHAYASTPSSGWATGRSPRPAPDWLHQCSTSSRRSIRLPSTYASNVVFGPGPVGRSGPPQPLREVSITMLMCGLNPMYVMASRTALV